MNSHFRQTAQTLTWETSVLHHWPVCVCVWGTHPPSCVWWALPSRVCCCLLVWCLQVLDSVGESFTSWWNHDPEELECLPSPSLYNSITSHNPPPPLHRSTVLYRQLQSLSFGGGGDYLQWAQRQSGFLKAAFILTSVCRWWTREDRSPSAMTSSAFRSTEEKTGGSRTARH